MARTPWAGSAAPRAGRGCHGQRRRKGRRRSRILPADARRSRKTARRPERRDANGAAPTPIRGGHARGCGDEDECILVLQGGGALGAYQAGVYEAWRSAAAPDWVAGISIGAINAALIAGNPPERRVERLREFWELVTSRRPRRAPAAVRVGGDRAWLQPVAARARDAVRRARLLPPARPPAAVQLPGAAPARSATTTPRRCARRSSGWSTSTCSTRREMRRSRRRGQRAHRQLRLFRHRHERARRAEHIMASGALPPGFPPVEIDGEHYWDGGLVSNTPLQYVLDQPGQPAAARVPGRPVPRARRAAARPRRSQRAREGHPLFQPHADEHRRVELQQQAIAQAARGSGEAAARAARRSRRAGARRAAPRGRGRRSCT